MKMQNIRQPFTRTCLLALAAIMLTITAASCRKMLYEYEGDCDPRYRVHFRYTRNILNTDAFGSQVSRVSLYLFDKQGNLVYRTTRQRALTADNDFYIEVDVEPGVYDMLVWCEGEPLTGDPCIVSHWWRRKSGINRRAFGYPPSRREGAAALFRTRHHEALSRHRHRCGVSRHLRRHRHRPD